MESILVYQNKHWQKELYKGLFNRDCLEEIKSRIGSNTIQVLSGIRRSGKSSIFKLLINDLMQSVNPQKILFINLDDPVFHSIQDDAGKLYDIISLAEKITKEKPEYIFLDEIQNVFLWEKFVKSIFDAGLFKKIFITGSNSSMLEGDLATLLTGRYLNTKVYPLSFKELLSFNGIHSELDLIEKKSKVFRIFDLVLEFGSFPEVLKNEENTIKRDITKIYFDTIISKDCLLKHDVRDKKTFTDLANYLSSVYSSVYSYTSLGKAIGSNENTTKSFLEHLKDSFILHSIQNFSYSLKITKRPKNKVYWIDNGLINAVNYRFSENKGRLLENLVFTELLKEGQNEITFYNDGNECDFIIRNPEKGDKAIQVVYEITPENQQREIEGLKKAHQLFGIKKGILLTYNQEFILEGFRAIPVWRFFC